MANIDDFKSSLRGGGARANQFRVTITAPTGISPTVIAGRDAVFTKRAVRGISNPMKIPEGEVNVTLNWLARAPPPSRFALKSSILAMINLLPR